MEELQLIPPSIEWEQEILSLRRELLEADGDIFGGSFLEDYEDAAQWLAWLDTLADPAACPPGLVPSVAFLCLRPTDGRVVGVVNIRTALNDRLRKFYGHIGYSIRPGERGKGYAKAQLKLTLREAARLGLERVLITCGKSNEASRRTILACGGVLENELWDENDGELVQRYWVEISSLTRIPEEAVMKTKVVLGLSGGVDSAVTARLLLEQGYAVTGVYLDIGAGGGGADDAAAAAASLGIPFVARPIADELEKHVCAPFAADYLAGRTPLPCARCNPLVKFPALLAEAQRIGADWVATGHYARAVDGGLYRGKPSNDQSYLLSRLPREILQRVIFPLGEYEKTAVRALAEQYGIPVAHKPDSMEICFVPNDDYAAWLEKRGDTAPTGDFIDKEGNVLGRHRGIHCYTLGQRRGLGVSGPHRYFVTAIDPASNTVILSDGGDLGRTEVLCTAPNWLTQTAPAGPFSCQVRLRHSRRADPAVVTPEEEGRVVVRSDTPLRAPTPGQLAVFYDGDRVIGSAWIL